MRASGLSAALALLPLSAAFGAAPPPDLLAAVEASQTFAPLGAGAVDGSAEARFYLLEGASRRGGPVARGAVLAQAPNGAQVVEVGEVGCETREIRPTYYLVFARDGRLMASGDPSRDEDAEGTFLPLGPAGNMMALLCDGLAAEGGLVARTLSDFRPK